MSINKIDKVGFYLNYFKNLESLTQKNQSYFKDYPQQKSIEEKKSYQRLKTYSFSSFSFNLSINDFEKPLKKLIENNKELLTFNFLKFLGSIAVNAPPIC